MSFFEIISTRHSVRQFEARSISANIVQRISSTAVRAPYEENLQSCKILAITKKDAKRRLAKAAHGQDSVGDAAVLVVFCADRGHVKTHE
ncbi:nitroreductase family protein [Candidatus Nitrosotenuis uzonensis]|uniref:nitroreductase family protein n=1 Tax=Candidatus Nitrosotenuis uzonensis TaxID=1407055 RepID=UPI00064F883D|nr:nitroreductase family protein [Candidatus Nitrosotenuis uzonensis]